MAARNASLSDDSRVVIDTRAALIIGGLLFGGLGLLGLGAFLAGRRIAEKIPHMPWSGHGHRHGAHPGHMAQMMRARMHEMPHVPQMPTLPKMPEIKIDVPAIMEMIAKLRRPA
jgi:hypothetical protein